MPATQPHPAPSRSHRRRWRAYSVTGVIGLGALAGQCAPARCAPAPPPAAAPSDAVQQVLDITNQRRAEHGLSALALNQALIDAAQGHSQDQAARDVMTHAGSDGSNAGQRIERRGYRWRAWAENVAVGYPDAASVMDGWMSSRLHRENILDVNGYGFTEIGIGLAYAADGSPYWTQVFARP